MSEVNENSNETFNKDDWKKQRQESRARAYEMLEEGTKSLTDTDKFKSYLDVQSRFDRYSVSNAILVAHQMPEAIKLGDSKYWQEQGVYINKGEKAITILEPGKEFTREDGTTGVNYNAKKVFDITQTNSEGAGHERKLPNENFLIKVLVKSSPVPVEITADLPDNIPAMYDKDVNEIYVVQGMNAEAIYRALSKEISHANMDKGNYNRDANELTAKAVSYILCRRMGFEPEGFDKSEKLFADKNPKEIRKELSKIRSEANSIITSMEKTIEARSRNRDAR